MRGNNHNEIGPKKSSAKQAEKDEFIARLKVKKNNVASEIAGTSNHKRVRQARRNHNPSKKFRTDGSTNQDYHDPRLKREQHEEDAWTKKRRKSSRKNRRSTILWLAAGLCVIVAIVAGLVYTKKSAILATPTEQQNYLDVQNQKVLDLPEFNTPIQADTTANLSSLEALASRSSQAKQEISELLDRISKASQVEDILPIARTYPGIENDIQNWLDSGTQGRRPRPESFFISPHEVGDLICYQLFGETDNFEIFVTYFLPNDAADGWLIDWASFIEKCEVPIFQLTSSQIDGEVELRALISAGSFFTPPKFAEETHSCYLIRALDSTHYVWGYARIDSPVERELNRLIQGGLPKIDSLDQTQQSYDKQSMRAMRIKIQRSPESILQSQFEIVAVLGLGWLEDYE